MLRVRWLRKKCNRHQRMERAQHKEKKKNPKHTHTHTRFSVGYLGVEQHIEQDLSVSILWGWSDSHSFEREGEIEERGKTKEVEQRNKEPGKGEGQGDESDGEMKVGGRAKIIMKDTRARERWCDSWPWPPRPAALQVLISQIDCIDFIALMWKISHYYLLSVAISV